MLIVKRISIAAALLAAFAIGTLGVRWIVDRTAPVQDLGSNIEANAPASLSPASFSTDAIIRNLQDYLRSHVADSVAYGNLGIAYLQKARETGDPAWYVKAGSALGKAYEIDPKDIRALMGLGSLALSRHQFRDALQWGEQARDLNPDNAAIYGIIGDAQIELGLYPAAFATFDQMVSLRPDLTSYARVSYARELSGDRPGAIEAMRRAVEASGDHGESANWVRVQIGNLYFDQGDHAEAEKWYQAALNSMPNYPYAEAGIANVWMTQGNTDQAIAEYTHLVNTFPLPQFVIALGDIYASIGHSADAERQYDLVDAEEQLFAANGVDVDAELALFDADHNRHLPEALERARAGYARRPSVTVADMLAWTLYKSGDYAEAQTVMNQALRLGTRNALMYFHAGMIAYQLGHMDVAADYLGQAIHLNPNFSLLHAGQAKSLLAELIQRNSATSDAASNRSSPKEK